MYGAHRAAKELSGERHTVILVGSGTRGGWFAGGGASVWAELQKKVTAYDQELARTGNEVSKERHRMSDLLMVSYVHSARQSARIIRIMWFFLPSGGVIFMLLDIPDESDC